MMSGFPLCIPFYILYGILSKPRVERLDMELRTI